MQHIGWKCVHMQHKGRSCDNRLLGHPENYIIEDFDPGRMKKSGRKPTRHYTALAARLVPDCSGFRGREKPELYETCIS